MAKDTTYISLTGLTEYDQLLKAKIQADIDAVDTKVTNIVDGNTKVPKATNADVAAKVGTADVGTANQPIYLKGGEATPITSIDVAHGGTGATTEAGARTKLDVYSKSEVGSAISTHNVAQDAHSDIRLLISELTTKVTNFLDVDDEDLNELSEIIALIDSNKESFEELLGNYVKYTDIIDNLTTTTGNKVLSANQGVAIKALIDALDQALQTHARQATHITADERTQWNAAQPNQNAFSKISVSGQNAVEADSATDTVTFVGTNVTITTNKDGDSVTFAVAEGSTTGKGIVQLSDSTTSSSSSTAATSKSVKSAYDLADEAKGLAEQAKSTADGKAPSEHSHTIGANVDNTSTVVELTGTPGTNSVTYKATHKDSGVTAGSYTKVTVNATGHVTAGSNPTTLDGYGIANAYTKDETDACISNAYVEATSAEISKLFES